MCPDNDGEIIRLLLVLKLANIVTFKALSLGSSVEQDPIAAIAILRCAILALVDGKFRLYKKHTPGVS
jgi:hypothetical protein